MMGHETCRGESLGFYLKEFVGLEIIITACI